MLSGAVHPVKRLLVENHLEMMLLRDLLHHYHEHHVLVDGLCGITEYGCTFELVRSHFIVTRLEKNAELVCLSLKIFHERAYP